MQKKNSSLHWLILSFCYAFFVQWSLLASAQTVILCTQTQYSIVQKWTIWEQNNSMETTRIGLIATYIVDCRGLDKLGV